MSKPLSRIIALLTVFTMLFSASVFAGPYPDGKGSGKYGKKKVGFFTKIGQSIKKASQKAATAVKKVVKKTGQVIKTAVVKTGMAIKTTGAKISNKIHDSAINAKLKITGKKNKTWVCGHYDKNGKWTKGHWRKVDPPVNNKPGWNTPSQGNHPGQSNSPVQSGKPLPTPDFGDSTTSSADNEQYTTADLGLAGDTNVTSSEAAPEVATNSAPEDPVLPEFDDQDNIAGDLVSGVAPEDPVLPEFDDNDEVVGNAAQQAQEPSQSSQQSSQASEQSSQSSQQASQTEEEEETEEAAQSGESEQASQFKKDTQISLRTMGMLMDDIVTESNSITDFRKSANSSISYSMDTQVNVNATYEKREKYARQLSRVIVWDLQTNNGKSGKYFDFFLYKMKTITPENQKMIKDVTEQVRVGIKHGAGHAGNEFKGLFEVRLNDISSY